MARKKNIDNIVLTLMYLAAYTNNIRPRFLTVNRDILRNAPIILGVIYFIFRFYNEYKDQLLPGNFKLKQVLFKNPLIFSWVLFSITIAISEMTRMSFPIKGLLYIFLSFLVFVLIIPNVLENPLRQIMFSAFISSYILIVISTSIVPLTIEKKLYYGIMSNPNVLAIITSQASVASIGLFFANSKIKDIKYSQYIYLLFFLFTLPLLLITRSRASFLALFISLVIFIPVFIIIKKLKFNKIIIPSILFVVIYVTKLHDLFSKRILFKFKEKISQGDITNGRFAIWKDRIINIKFFGYGVDKTEAITQGSHNTIISFLTMYGVMPGFFLTLIFVISLIYSVKYLIKNKDDSTFFVPFLFTVFFILLSLSEIMFALVGTGLTLVFFNILGVLLVDVFKNTKEPKII